MDFLTLKEDEDFSAEELKELGAAIVESAKGMYDGFVQPVVEELREKVEPIVNKIKKNLFGLPKPGAGVGKGAQLAEDAVDGVKDMLADAFKSWGKSNVLGKSLFLQTRAAGKLGKLGKDPKALAKDAAVDVATDTAQDAIDSANEQGKNCQEPMEDYSSFG